LNPDSIIHDGMYGVFDLALAIISILVIEF